MRTPFESIGSPRFPIISTMSMSFSFGFGWAKDDPNNLCMREGKLMSEGSYLGKSGTPDMKSFVFQFELARPYFPEPLHANEYRMSEDYEQISAFMVCRLLTKCSDVLLYPDGSAPAVKLLCGDAKSLLLLKSKVGLGLTHYVAKEDSESSGNEDVEHFHHTVMFQVYNSLMEKGWTAFATDSQLRGVVAKPVSSTEFYVAALTNCTINYRGEGLLSVEMSRYKVSPLSADMIEEHAAAASRTLQSSVPSWRSLERSMQCVFLPTAEEVQLTATISYLPAHAVTCNPAQYREYEKRVFLTPLDVANKARGFSAYVPDSYARAKLYWELAYGILLPKSPGVADNVMFGRIQTALGEQIVPLSALARGVAEIPWKAEHAAGDAASRVHEAIQDLPCFSELQRPQRPHELSEQLRQRYCAVETSAGKISRSPFVSALRMRNAQQATSDVSHGPATAPPPLLRHAAATVSSLADADSQDSMEFSLFGDVAAAAPAPQRQPPPPAPAQQQPCFSAPPAPRAAPTISARSAPSDVGARQGPQGGVQKRSSAQLKAPAPSTTAAARKPSTGSDSSDLDLSSDSDSEVIAPVTPKAALKRKQAAAAHKAGKNQRKKKD